MITAQSTQHSLLENLFDAPLYKSIEIPSGDASKILRAIRTTSGQRIDRYCPSCGKSTTWTVVISSDDERQAKLEQATVISSHMGTVQKFNWFSSFQLRLNCARHNHHLCTLFFVAEREPMHVPVENKVASTDQKQIPTQAKILKVGQYPSLTDIQLGTLNEFEEGMTTLQRKEFVRAINTSAHGFNVAACLHYRRLFESILFDARDVKLKSDNVSVWPEFENMSAGDKIASLRDFLPSFMVDHPHLYTILSKGVHELTEDECGEEMPMLRQAIELMIQDKVDATKREKRRNAASKMIAQTVNKLR